MTEEEKALVFIKYNIMKEATAMTTIGSYLEKLSGDHCSEQIENFNFGALYQEFKEKGSLVVDILNSFFQTLNLFHSGEDEIFTIEYKDRKNKQFYEKSLIYALAILLFSKSQKSSGLQLIISLLLVQNNARKKVRRLLSIHYCFVIVIIFIFIVIVIS